jgi:hypothetical protein
MRIPGDAVLEVGERCVLFLRTQDGGWFLTALEQSKYRIEETPKGALLTRPTTATEWEIDDEGRLRLRERRTPPMKTLASLIATLAKNKRRP